MVTTSFYNAAIKLNCVLVMGNIGCVSGGQVIKAARDRYVDALNALIRLASLQVNKREMVLLKKKNCCFFKTSFLSLDEEIKMTNRRVNALNSVSINFNLFLLYSFILKKLWFGRLSYLV
jgi:vacuolar-type H+-ATPase subunit D/Vma8